MKAAGIISVAETPGALAVETLGVQTATSTSTTSWPPPASTPAGTDFGPPAEGRPARSGPALPDNLVEGASGPARSAAPTVRVLLVDDSASVREALARVLIHEGYEVLLAGNGQEALEKFRPGLIDLVLLDLEMPVKSGWDTFEEIVALDGNQAIILMADRLDSVDLTTTGHLTRLAEKPINVTSLLTAIKKALAEPSLHRRSTITNPQNLARFAKPYVPSWPRLEAYDHWGIND